MGTIHGKAEFGILVKAFQHRHTHSVAQPPVLRRLVGTVQRQIRVIKKLVVFPTRAVQELMLGMLEVKSPDETRHGYIGAVDDGIGHTIAAITVKAHLITLVQPQLAAFQMAVSSTQQCGDALVIDFGLTTLHFGRIGDITVVGDAAALLGGVVIVVEKRLHLVAVTHV